MPLSNARNSLSLKREKERKEDERSYYDPKLDNLTITIHFEYSGRALNVFTFKGRADPFPNMENSPPLTSRRRR